MGGGQGAAPYPKEARGPGCVPCGGGAWFPSLGTGLQFPGSQGAAVKQSKKSLGMFVALQGDLIREGVHSYIV